MKRNVTERLRDWTKNYTQSVTPGSDAEEIATV